MILKVPRLLDVWQHDSVERNPANRRLIGLALKTMKFGVWEVSLAEEGRDLWSPTHATTRSSVDGAQEIELARGLPVASLLARLPVLKGL